jgi:parallel beta-helix repeat protein
MNRSCVLARLILVAILAGGCKRMPEQLATSEVEYPIPTPSRIQEPEPVSLPEDLQDNVCNGGEILLTSDTDSVRFEGCIVLVKQSGISITRSEFVNSRILIEATSDVVLSDNVIRDYPVYEEAAVVIGVSNNIVFRHNHVRDNTIGIAIGESQNVRLENNIFESNYQHNGITVYKSSAEISGSLLRYNYPHGILVHFAPEQGKTTVSIHDNVFFMNIEDAIDFEDWRNAKDESRIHSNVITGTAWAGINVEYNSWHANILIENNYVGMSGYPIEMFPKGRNAPEEWSNGWGHGIKLEDCSGITVKGNTILDNEENGIDIRNCRGVTLEGNTVTGNDVGVFVGGPCPGSFTREVSPLSEEDAGPSIVVFKGNYVFKNDENIVEEGSD